MLRMQDGVFAVSGIKLVAFRPEGPFVRLKDCTGVSCSRTMFCGDTFR